MELLKEICTNNFNEYRDENGLTPLQNSSLKLIDKVLQTPEATNEITEFILCTFSFFISQSIGLSPQYVSTNFLLLSYRRMDAPEPCEFLLPLGAEVIGRTVKLFSRAAPTVRNSVIQQLVTVLCYCFCFIHTSGNWVCDVLARFT